MKDRFTSFVDGVFVFLLTICPLQCLASSFGINISLGTVIIFTAIVTTIFAIIAVSEKNKRKNIIWLGVIFTIFALILLMSGNTLLNQLNYAVNKVLSVYSEYLPVAPRIYFSKSIAIRATELFVAVSVLLSGLLTFFIVRLKRTLPVCIISIILVVPCFVLVNTLPALLGLLTMVAVLFTLFIGGYVRRINVTQSGAISSVVAALMAVLIAVVYTLNPVDGYVRNSWQDKLLSFATNLTSVGSYEGADDILSISAKSLHKEIDLSNVGPREKTHQPIMTIKTSYSGKLYLRGVAYANYEDNKWSILTDEQTESYPVDYSSAVMTKSYSVEESVVNISTNREMSMIYTPYYLCNVPYFGTELCDVLIKNDADTKEYGVSFQLFEVEKYKPMGQVDSTINPSNYTFTHKDSEQYEEYKNFVYLNYLYVPNEVKAEMLRHAQEKGFLDLPKTEVIDEVKSYIKDSAKYSLETEKVPKGEDISTWLLNESDTGYCVHFATSLAMMLRSLEIPARYVTGYCVYPNANEITSVTSDEAHAWVEYFDDNIGWVPIDSTPPDFTSTDVIEGTDTEENPQQTATQSPTDSQTDIQQSQSVTETQQTGNAQATDSSNKVVKPAENEPLIVVIIEVIVAVAALILLSIIILVLRRIVVLKLRKRSFSKSNNNNNRVRHIYRYIMKTSKYSRVPIPKEVPIIAEKARFGYSRISHSELDVMLRVAESREKALIEDSPFIKKLYFKYIIALA